MASGRPFVAIDRRRLEHYNVAKQWQAATLLIHVILIPFDRNIGPGMEPARLRPRTIRHQWPGEAGRSTQAARDMSGLGIGCLECKKPVIDSVIAELEPIQKEASQYEKDRELVRSILIEGSEKARESARETLSDVRAAMGLSSW